MAQQDLHNYIKTYVAFNTQAISTNTTTVGNIIDTQFYESVEFALIAGTLDATTVFTPVIEESNDATFATDVTVVPAIFTIGTTNVTGERPSYGAATDPIGDATFLGVAESNTSGRIGVLNKKRYVRLSIVTTLRTTGGTMTALAILSHAHKNPTPKY